MWLLWQLFSNQKKIPDQSFEYRLILEYEDKQPLDIEVSVAHDSNEYASWLSTAKEKAPFEDDRIPNKTCASLCVAGVIDLTRLLEKEPTLSNIYLWASTLAKREQIYVETKRFEVGRSLESAKTSSLNSNKNFIELYASSPQKHPSDRYEQIENQRIDSEGFYELLALMRKDDENLEQQDPKKSLSDEDFKSLVEGFNEWQRSRGRSELIDKLPDRLVDKIKDKYEIAFWSSGQGISNMIRDDNPPRHTMVLSINDKSSQEGYGYCIRKPTSLDRVWTYQKWHKIKFIDNEIVEVSALDI